MFLGFIIGKIVSPLVLGVIFFGLLTPVALFTKLIGRDELNLVNKNQVSFWKSKEKIKDYKIITDLRSKGKSWTDLGKVFKKTRGAISAKYKVLEKMTREFDDKESKNIELCENKLTSEYAVKIIKNELKIN